MTGATFSKAGEDVLEVIGGFYVIILTTAACYAVQGRKGQPNGSLQNRSRRVQGSN